MISWVDVVFRNPTVLSINDQQSQRAHLHIQEVEELATTLIES